MRGQRLREASSRLSNAEDTEDAEDAEGTQRIHLWSVAGINRRCSKTCFLCRE